jgi:excinuclease UvrABC nuclease subunit
MFNNDITGCYILRNNNNGKYYVGQSKNVNDRVNKHFPGHGSPDVYFDYRKGDDISVMILKLKDTNYDSLNQMERELIIYYDSYNKGYNKNRGNGVR